AVLTGQLSGFEGEIWAGSAGSEAWKLRAWNTDGSTLAEGPVQSGDLIAKEDPLGGLMVVNLTASPKTLASYDEHLNFRWQVDIIANRGIGGFAVDRAGRTLVL